MASSDSTLRPQPRERGLASWDPSDVAALLAPAWQAAVDLAARVDLDAPTRVPDRTVRQVLAPLGEWDDEPHRFEQALTDARAGRISSAEDADARHARVVSARHDVGRDELAAALARTGDRVLEILSLPDADVIGRRAVHSTVGPMPLTSAVAAAACELAVHVLDVEDATGEAVPDALLDVGVGTLVEVVGALTARAGTAATVAVVTPQGCWATGTDEEHAWTTIRLDVDLGRFQRGWPGIAGDARDVLDAASGRALAAELVLTRSLRLSRPAGLLRVLPALRHVPGLPGGSAAEATLQAAGQTGRLVRAVSGRLSQRLTAPLRR